jgi:hypothetical protein
MEFINMGIGIFRCQHTYAQKILKEFGLNNCNDIVTLFPKGLKIWKEKQSHLIDLFIFKHIIFPWLLLVIIL